MVFKSHRGFDGIIQTYMLGKEAHLCLLKISLSAINMVELCYLSKQRHSQKKSRRINK